MELNYWSRTECVTASFDSPSDICPQHHAFSRKPALSHYYVGIDRYLR
jgi:hypothetical protein